MLALKLLALAAFSPTQHGKTTFIRRMGAAIPNSAIGTGDGRSITTEPHRYAFNITYADAIQPLVVIDTPGLGDTELRKTDSEIIKSCLDYLEQHKVERLDAILIFHSLAQKRYSVTQSLQKLTNFMGDIKSSVVIVLSKADLSQQAMGSKADAIAQCEELDLPYLLWSDAENDKEMDERVEEFMHAVRNVRPYRLSQYREIEGAIFTLATSLRDMDPYRYIVQRSLDGTQLEKFLSQAKTEHSEIGNRTHVVRVESPKNCIETLADFLTCSWNFFITFGWKIKQISTRAMIEYYPLDQKTVKSEEWIRLKNLLNSIKNSLQNDESTSTVKIERHPFEHYLSSARETIISNSVNKGRPSDL